MQILRLGLRLQIRRRSERHSTPNQIRTLHMMSFLSVVSAVTILFSVCIVTQLVPQEPLPEAPAAAQE